MVKRAKLTLKHTEVKEADFPEAAVPEQSVTSDNRGNLSNLSKMLIMAGLTIVSLIIFKQKIF